MESSPNQQSFQLAEEIDKTWNSSLSTEIPKAIRYVAGYQGNEPQTNFSDFRQQHNLLPPIPGFFLYPKEFLDLSEQQRKIWDKLANEYAKILGKSIFDIPPGPEHGEYASAQIKWIRQHPEFLETEGLLKKLESQRKIISLEYGISSIQIEPAVYYSPSSLFNRLGPDRNLLVYYDDKLVATASIRPFPELSSIYSGNELYAQKCLKFEDGTEDLRTWQEWGAHILFDTEFTVRRHMKENIENLDLRQFPRY